MAIACEGGESTKFPNLDKKRFPKNGSGYYLYDYVVSGKNIEEWYVKDNDPKKHLQFLKTTLEQNVPLHFYEYVPQMRDYFKANSRNFSMNFIPLPSGLTLSSVWRETPFRLFYYKFSL